MKNLKKLGSIALALVMVMAMMIPAFAQEVKYKGADKSSGSITITNATVDQTYSVYKVFDATYSGEHAAYSIKNDSPWYSIVNASGSVFALTPTTTTGVYNVAKAIDTATGEAYTDAQVLAWLQAQTLPSTATASTEAIEANLTFSQLPFGYYIVKSSLNNGGTLTITNADPDATVIDKNQLPGGQNDGKKVTSIDGVAITTQDKSAEIGDVIGFEIRYTATNYRDDKQITNYRVSDNMPDGLTLNTGSIAVKVGTADLTLGTDYTITYSTVDTDDFDINIPWTNGTTSKYASPVEIVVTYTATVNDATAISGDGNRNSANVYDTANGTETKGWTTDKSDTVYSYAIALKKVNKDGEALAGATFTLTDANGGQINVKGENGVYTVDANGTASIVSPASGLIVIKGVKNQQYTLTETVAPTGYNLMGEGKEVTPTLVNGTTTNTTFYLDENGTVTNVETSKPVTVEYNDVAATPVVVVNFTGAVLPSTGGMGTTIFYAIGGILLAGSAILFVTKKRMGE